jgi:hypothetical protein
VADDVYLTAPDGPMVADVRLGDRWTWIVVALGAGIVAAGAVLFAPGSHAAPAGAPVAISCSQSGN